MAYPSNFLRLVVSGTLYGTEQFSWSLALARNFETDPPPSTVPQGVIDAVTALHASTSAACGTSALLTMIKLNEIGTDGRYVSQSETVMHEFETGVPGSGTSTQPPQNALAVTLRTAKRRGRAHAGRFYLPRTGGGVANDGRITGGTADSLAVDVTTFLDAINAAIPGNWRAAVMSDVGTGTLELVTHAEIGRVVDTIRSRRSSMDEDRRSGLPLAP